jgi:hypothetical protein
MMKIGSLVEFESDTGETTRALVCRDYGDGYVRVEWKYNDKQLSKFWACDLAKHDDVRIDRLTLVEA